MSQSAPQTMTAGLDDAWDDCTTQRAPGRHVVKGPDGYCPDHGTGVACPVGDAARLPIGRPGPAQVV